MRIVRLDGTDPAWNLAAEEILLAHAAEDVFLLWQNRASVIIGRNQNAWAEVNVPYVTENGIPVVRRLSGGGAVFHDLGNINFSFIIKTDAPQIDFARFTAPIVRALSALGIPAAADGRNDIVVGDAKISGNAQCTYRRPDGALSLLHHGTLLFCADLTHLSSALAPRPEKLRAKGIASVRARVANLAALPGFPCGMTVDACMAHLARTAAEDGTEFPLTAAETDAVSRLAEEKYRTWEWNWGQSAPHETEHVTRFPGGTLSAAYTARRGAIESIAITGDFFGTAPVAQLEAQLRGVPLRPDALLAAIDALPAPLTSYIAGATPDILAGLILGDGT